MNSAEQTAKPFHERPLFQGTAAVVALATALLALLGPLRDTIDGLGSDPPPRSAWTAVVLNASAVMGERFGRGDQTAFESALYALEESLEPLDTNGVSLHSTPETCDDESERLVDLTTGSTDEVIREAKEQSPHGRASIIDPVRAAMAEFEQEPMQSHPAESKKLFVFTTDTTPCEWDDLFEDEVRSDLHRMKRYGAVEVFALKPQPDQEKMISLTESGGEGPNELDVLADALGPQMEIHYVETPEELYEQAEEAGEEARETTEEIEDHEGSGTSDEGQPE